MNLKFSSVFLILLFTYINIYSQDKEIEKVILEFKYSKSRDTEYIIDYVTKELTCKMFDFSRHGNREIIFNEKYKFTNDNIKIFNKQFLNDIPRYDVVKGEDGYDGGKFIFSYIKSKKEVLNLEVRNANWNKDKYSDELDKVELFFNLAYSIVTDTIGISILDSSYAIYYRGLPVRKVSDNPLEYKIWGNINGSFIRNTGLLDFLNNLPKDRCVIIDCDESLSYALQEDILKLYILENSNIKFVNNGYLKYTQDEINKLLKDIEVCKNNVAKFDEKYGNTSIYKLYMSNPNKMKNWAKIPKESLSRNINEIRKECQ